jgi:hypothetical protein
MTFNLGNGEEPIDVLIGAILLTTFQIQIKEPLMNYKDVFAWDYKESKGIPKDLDRLLNTRFIYLITTIQWLSTLVNVPKKNDKLRICVDYHEMNVQMKKIHFLHLF